MAWGIAFGELLRGGLWGVFCGYVEMRTHFLSINPPANPGECQEVCV